MVDSSRGISKSAGYGAIFIDSVERSKGRARLIIEQKMITPRHEEETVGCAPRVRIAAYDLILVVIAKNDRARRARRLTRRVNSTVRIAVVSVSHPRGVYVIATARVRPINLIRQSRRRIRHHEVRQHAPDVDEGRL